MDPPAAARPGDGRGNRKHRTRQGIGGLLFEGGSRRLRAVALPDLQSVRNGKPRSAEDDSAPQGRPAGGGGDDARGACTHDDTRRGTGKREGRLLRRDERVRTGARATTGRPENNTGPRSPRPRHEGSRVRAQHSRATPDDRGFGFSAGIPGPARNLCDESRGTHSRAELDRQPGQECPCVLLHTALHGLPRRSRRNRASRGRTGGGDSALCVVQPVDLGHRGRPAGAGEGAHRMDDRRGPVQPRTRIPRRSSTAAPRSAGTTAASSLRS